MDAAKQRAISACGTCGQSEEAHQHRTGTDSGELDIFAALGGACTHFVVSDAALAYAQHLALAARDPAPAYGKPRRRRPQMCPRCLNRGHRKEDCPI